MKDRVVLITPPSPFLLDERVFMHIGILKVASSLESKGHSVEFLDLSGIDNYLDVVRDYAKSCNCNTFGITNNSRRSSCYSNEHSIKKRAKEGSRF